MVVELQMQYFRDFFLGFIGELNKILKKFSPILHSQLNYHVYPDTSFKLINKKPMKYLVLSCFLTIIKVKVMYEETIKS